jgi:glutamine amidotransferase
MKVTVVDYNLGNLFSVRRAFESQDATVEISSDPRAIERADRLVLPGVGAFGHGMDELRQRSLVDPLRRFGERERPFLGICLGMQMMFERAEEFGEHLGLGLIAGGVAAIPTTDESGRRHKIPHIGWTAIAPAPSGRDWNGTILAGIEPGTEFYFVHSFTAHPVNAADRLADAFYDGCHISAAVTRGAIVGCQFHPERSGPVGLKVLSRFLDL